MDRRNFLVSGALLALLPVLKPLLAMGERVPGMSRQTWRRDQVYGYHRGQCVLEERDYDARGNCVRVSRHSV